MIGVYRFLDSDNNTIYIGRATGKGGFKQRLETHNNESFVNKFHYLNCYRDTVNIECLKCKSKSEADFYEKYFINTIRPKYNLAGYSKSFQEIIPYLKKPKNKWFNYSAYITKKEKNLAMKIRKIFDEYYSKYSRKLNDDSFNYYSFLDNEISDLKLSLDQIQYCINYHELINDYEEICLKFRKAPYKQWHEL